MTTFFFLIGMIFLVYEFSIILNPSSNLKMLDYLKSEDKNKKIQGCFIVFFNLFYLIWTIIGMALSHQWKYFALILLIGIFDGILNKIFESLKVFMKRLDAIVSCIILFWIFINHFHPGTLIDFLSW